MSKENEKENLKNATVCLCFYSSIKIEAVQFLYANIFLCIYYKCIYIKPRPKRKKLHEQKFCILCENLK